MKASDEPVIVEQTFNATPEKVWQAITEHEQMIQWYFDNIPDFKAEVGFETQFNIHNEGRDFLHMWNVTEVEPLKKITYGWKFEGYAGDSFVTFEIFDEGDTTKLRLTATVTEDFQDGIPEFQRESCIGGWQYFIQQRLKEYLEK
jgi:uncharacterized protein YndB with AHSA1/START domain